MSDFGYMNQLAMDIHENAVKHGWYEKEPTFASVTANLHAELSEAWEEHRKGRPMMYHLCSERKLMQCTEEQFQMQTCSWISRDENGVCLNRSAKPEGIAVELADVVIRILDYCEHTRKNVWRAIQKAEVVMTRWGRMFLRVDVDYPGYDALIAYLHELVTCAYAEDRMADSEDEKRPESYWGEAILLIDDYIQRQGDGHTLEELIRLKHVYNLTRPYKHGGLIV